MWEVWYGLEAANYLADNGELVAALSFAMEALAETNGWPQSGDYAQAQELVSWQILDHLVVYQRLENQQIVQIAAIIPS
ncbi:MAG: hypothetical protein U0350_27230 [Caldilineaceae bacterium]